MKKPSESKLNVPLSIAFVYDDTLDGNEGVAQYVKTLGAWLSAKGHSVNYLVGETKLTSWQDGKIYSLSKNLRVIFNGNRLSMPLVSSRRSIKAALSQTRPDVLNVQLPHSPLMAQRVINMSNCGVVGTFHIFPAGRLASVGTKLLRYLYLGGLKKLDDCVSVSPAAQKFAADAFGLDTEVVPNMINSAKLESPQKNLDMTVVFMGRLVERKGCRQLIEAFKLVHEQLPSAKLIIGGGGQRPELEDLAARLGLLDSVEFKGFIEEKQKGAFLAQASVACFPSLYGESFGIVLIEAMAAGAGAVIGGHNPGYATVLAERADLLFDPEDKQRLSQKIADLLRDRSKRDEIKKWQADYVKRFDVNVVGPQMLDRFERVIAKKAASRHN